MTPYTVDWLSDVLDVLANVWVLAPDRRAVTAAQSQIDRLLSRDPLGAGHHLSEGLYRLDVPPLSVTYTVDTARKFVEVSSVRPI